MVVRKYDYYNNGRVETIKDYTDVLGDSSTYEKKSYTYDIFGRIETMVYVGSSGEQIESYSYSYDKNSNIVSKNVEYSYTKLQVKENKEYVYNQLGQLIESKSTDSDGTSTSIYYTYDAVGNRKTMTDNKMLTETTYEYNQLNQLISSETYDNFNKKATSKLDYVYDENGNEISKVDSITGESVDYKYDEENRLIYVSGKKSDGTSYTQENRYNGSGQRIYKKDTEIADTTTVEVTKYYYQNGMVAYTTDESGALKTYNYYGADNNIISSTRYDSDSTSYYVYNKDVQGSTTTIVDSDGKSCVGYTYDDFGTTTVYNVKNNLQNEITYTGAIFDSSTGLYYMNARYYDSEIGRFISQDTYRGEKNDAGTWHLYAYCANDPINYVDPSGHSKIWNGIKTGLSKLSNQARSFFKNHKLTVSRAASLIDVAITVSSGGAWSISWALARKQGKTRMAWMLKEKAPKLLKIAYDKLSKVLKVAGLADFGFSFSANAINACFDRGWPLTTLGAATATLIDVMDGNRNGYLFY